MARYKTRGVWRSRVGADVSDTIAESCALVHKAAAPKIPGIKIECSILD